MPFNPMTDIPWDTPENRERAVKQDKRALLDAIAEAEAEYRRLELLKTTTKLESIRAGAHEKCLALYKTITDLKRKVSVL